MNSTLLAEIDKIKNLEPNWNSYQDNHVSDVAAFIAKELVERLDLDDTCFCPLKDGGMWLLVLNGKNDIEVYIAQNGGISIKYKNNTSSNLKLLCAVDLIQQILK